MTPASKHKSIKIGARGFPLRLISSLGVRGGGLARIQNCSAGGVGGVQPTGPGPRARAPGPGRAGDAGCSDGAGIGGEGSGPDLAGASSGTSW